MRLVQYATALALVLGTNMAVAATQLSLSGPAGFFAPGELTYDDPVNGLSVRVFAGTHPRGSGADAPFRLDFCLNDCVVRASRGIGVRLSTSDNTPQLDSQGPDEFLLVSFSRAVFLQSVWFNAAGANANGSDEFDFAVDGVDFDVDARFGSDTLVDFPNSNLPQTPGPDRLVAFDPTEIRGTDFLFYTDDDTDNYIISQLEYTPVPVPAALPLMVAGMGGLALVRRGQRKAATL
ncbi:MAG: VPLPA-CTERM sorting domain-containing protein [Pseudomonadota bacterium]